MSVPEFTREAIWLIASVQREVNSFNAAAYAVKNGWLAPGTEQLFIPNHAPFVNAFYERMPA